MQPLAFFVGEAPGPDEDLQGRPFIGRAGRILRDALHETGWREPEFWITNTAKCFPHEMLEGRRKIRAPLPGEVAACAPHLGAELSSLRPRLVVALGRVAANALSAEKLNLDRDHGRVLPATATRPPVLVTFHPSGLHYRTERRAAFRADLVAARSLAVDAPAAR